MRTLAAVPAEPSGDNDIGKPSVLIVDDEPRICSSYARLLGAVGYQVEQATCGEDALERLRRRRFDVAILDVSLPDLSGIEMLARLKEDKIDAEVILFSADDRIDVAIQALRLGAFEFVRKSAEPEELIQSVGNAVERGNLERSHRRLTAQMERSERLHRFLVDQSPDLIYTLDQHGRFIFVNDRVATLIGYDRSEILGQHYSMLVHPDDLERGQYAFRERRCGDRASSNVEIRLRCKDDRFRDFDNRTVVAMLSSFGVYEADDGATTKEFLGTYGVARDITERKRAEEAISYHAFHDLLTGLPNRSLFKDRLALALAHAHRNKKTVGLMYLDLDRFKQVNDTLGHAAGDELLKIFASRVRQCLRTDDTLARQGGDEFTALLPDLASPDAAEMIAGKIQAALQPPAAVGGRDLRMAASIGIALYPDDATDAAGLLQAADIAMYAVKMHGKNGSRRYHSDMSRMHRQRVAFERDLEAACDLGQLEVHYQPQISVRSRKVTGVEALVRWRHPTQGLIGPGLFIPLAEENGVIFAISDYVLDKSCAQLAAWRKAGISDLRVSVNISPQEFLRNDLIDRLVRPVDRHGIGCQDLEVEITENLLMEDAEIVLDKVRSLHSRGIRVAIDDFGVRYSSLNYLRRFQVSCLKIDQSFVGEINDDEGTLPIVQAIVSLAQGFGLDLVAEGVETEDQLRQLWELGCDHMQGYYFGRPAPAADLDPLLRAASYDLPLSPGSLLDRQRVA